MGPLLLVLALVAIFAITAKAQGREFDVADYSTQDTAGYPSYVVDFSQAVAHAEGWGRVSAVPTETNNPLDLGNTDDGSKINFPSLADGWAAGYRQIEMMFNNTSRIYSSGMSIAEVSNHYASDHANWRANVVDWLQRNVNGSITENTTLDELRALYA